MEQIVDSPQVVRSLDVPVPQRENQLVEACRHLDLPIPEQAIEVPKISSTPRPPRRRRVRFAEQTAEQLVEVSTIISYSSLRGILKVFPVHRARAVRTLNLCITSSVLASGSHCSGRLGIAEEYGYVILREMTFLRGCNAWFSVDICSASVLWWLW